MTRYANTVLAACAAVVLTLSSIGAIVTVPTAQAQDTFSVTELA